MIFTHPNLPYCNLEASMLVANGFPSNVVAAK